MKDYFNASEPIRFIFPVNGDCLNAADGKTAGAAIKVTVSVAAPPDGDIYINGKKAVFKGDRFESEEEITGYRTSLTAENRKTGDSASIAVFRLTSPEKKFRVSSDDNIRFLKNLTDNADRYGSLFDDPYLNMYKRVHDETGACVHLNLFYRSGDGSLWEGEQPFDLSMMTDRYKKEWEANSDWLRLSFHSLCEHPMWPYKNATYEEMYNDAKAVNDQIVRFAGEKTLACTTTVHFGASNETAMRAIRNLGYKNAAGYFEFDSEGNPMVAYHYPKELITHIGGRDFWRDTELDITYLRIDRVMNLDKTVEGNLAELEKVLAVPTRAGFVELMIHEQYFYKKYAAYIEKFGEIVLACCEYLKKRGYASCFIEDVAKPY